MAADELFDLAIEVLHAFGAADAHSIKQSFAVAFALVHVLAGAQSGFQYLEHSHASFAILARKQSLGNEVAERRRQAPANSSLIGRWKHAHYALDRLRG